MAWLTGWGYRKSHIINSAAGAGTNYQICIKVYKGTGTDGTEQVSGVTAGKVYCNNHCRDDFGDIRFTKDDTTTLLDYWMESKVNGDNAVFWIEIADDLSTVSRTIYVYYGKGDATTTSNGDNAFPVFIDHEAGNLSEWTTWGAGTKTASQEHPHTGSYDCKLTPPTSPSSGGVEKATADYDAGYAYRIWIYDVPTKAANYAENTYIIDGGNVELYLGANGAADYYQYWDGSGWINSSVLRTAGFHYFEFRLKSGHVLVIIDGTQVLDSTRLNTATMSKFRAYCYGANPNPSWFDDFLIRKWVDPEPSHGSWGSEETETVLNEVVDSLGLSDSLSCGKAFVVADSVGLFDASLRDWILQSSDVIAVSDMVFRGKQFSVSDSVGVSELVTVVTEIVRQVTDSVTVSDVVGLHRALLLTDQIQLAENVYVNKVLIVADGVALAEIVEKAVAGAVKTKIFLVMGDVAIQLTGG